MTLVPFRWEPDPDFTGAIPKCPVCFSSCEALRVNPDRSRTYLTHIFLCTGDSGNPGPAKSDGSRFETCRMAWPYYGARRLEHVA